MLKNYSRSLFCAGLVGFLSSLALPQTAFADAVQPYVGEIVCGGWNFCPLGWAACNGQLMPISENTTLFSLIGTTYGGDGQQTFAMPDLRGRTMLHQGSGFVIGQQGGAENVTLNSSQMPAHSHAVQVHAGNEKSASPTGRIPGVAAGTAPIYTALNAPLVTMGASAVAPTGGGQPHNNLQPYLTMTCCISLFGIFPSQN